jgi:hypothetical protein
VAAKSDSHNRESSLTAPIVCLLPCSHNLGTTQRHHTDLECLWLFMLAGMMLDVELKAQITSEPVHFRNVP